MILPLALRLGSGADRQKPADDEALMAAHPAVVSALVIALLAWIAVSVVLAPIIGCAIRRYGDAP